MRKRNIRIQVRLNDIEYAKLLDDIEKYVKFLPKGLPDEEKEKDDGHLGKKRNRNKNKKKKE